MIQFNLLPDVKKEYIKAKRTKRLITSVSMLAIIVSIVVVGVLFSIVQFGQKKHITDLTEDISSNITEINEIEDLDKILTIQNQLDSLTFLHQDKPEASRLFSYLTSLAPADATIDNLDVDFLDSTMIITGTAKDIATVNLFADTLKFTKFTAEPLTADTEGAIPSEEMDMFSSVLTQVSRSESDTNYVLETTFDSQVFDNTLAVVLRVPDTVTTRSVLNRPDIGQNGLFDDTNADLDILINEGSQGN